MFADGICFFSYLHCIRPTQRQANRCFPNKILVDLLAGRLRRRQAWLSVDKHWFIAMVIRSNALGHDTHYKPFPVPPRLAPLSSDLWAKVLI